MYVQYNGYCFEYVGLPNYSTKHKRFYFRSWNFPSGIMNSLNRFISGSSWFLKNIIFDPSP